VATRIGEAARRVASNGEGARERVRQALPDGVTELDLSGAARRVARDQLESVWPSTATPATPRAAEQAGADYGRRASPGWREIDWREHLRRTDVRGQAVNYVDLGAGDGVPVVFVHGLGGNWQNWLENLPAAAEHRRVLALDLPGFGESPRPRWEISVPNYGQLVDAWLAQLGLDRVAVVGNSMGGFISAELAIRSSERVERLVLAAAAGISVTNLRRRPTKTFARVTAALGALTATRSRDIITRRRLRHVVLSTIVRHPSRLEPDLLFEIMRGSGRSGYVDALEALVTYDIRDSLGQIRCPTLILWGREDMLVPVKDAAAFERLIPASRQIVMEDTGHVPMLERPDAFNRCLVDFLAEDGTGQ
jgi:pimeloyl-ACP methyl ester carboxylesterase